MKVLSVAALTAILTALAFPPFDFGPAAYVALVPLLLFTGRDGRGGRDLLAGWLCGWAASTAVVWWVVNTIGHYGGIPWSLAIPIVLLLTWVLGFIWALFAWARGRILRRLPLWTDAAVSAILWTALEYGWSNVPDIAFPWVLMGYSQYQALPIIQIADLFGVWGVSFLVLFVNGAIASMISPGGPAGGRPGPVRRFAPALAALLLILAAWSYGDRRLADDRSGEGIDVVVVQGNVDQAVKWNPAFRRDTFELYRALTREGTAGGGDLVVWPETAVPFYYQFEPAYRGEILALARETGASLLFGSPAREGTGSAATLRNRAYLVSAGGEDIGWYDKVNLVPFGEFVPWGKLLFFVEKMVQAVGDFSPGPGPVTLSIDGTSIGTLVCYEVIFPDLVRRSVNDGARILVNITNDAWFGRTAASAQHFSTLVFRAVENRRPIARAANTGISGFVDARGVVLEQSELFVRGQYGARLVPSSERTLYGRIGDLLPAVCAALGALLLLAGYRGKREKRKYRL